MWAVSLSRPEPGQQPRLTVSEAAARGLTRANLRSSGWRSPYRGLHVLGPAVAAEDLAPGDRIRDAAALLPVDGQVGGWAAAYLLGVEVLDGRRPGSGAAPVPLLLPPHHHPRKRSGIDWERTGVVPADRQQADGLTVTSPGRTAFDLLRGPDRVEAVVAGDAVLRTVGGRPRLRQLLADTVRWPHVQRARRAYALLDPRAASPPETRLRLVWVLGGLPPPLVNPSVYDPRGRHLGTVDLLDADAGLAVEYDGAHHRGARQHAADNRREERLEAHGLVVVRVSAPDLPDRDGSLLHRLSEARARGLARDRSRDRWHPGPDLWPHTEPS